MFRRFCLLLLLVTDAVVLLVVVLPERETNNANDLPALIYDRASELFYYLKGGHVDYGEENGKACRNLRCRLFCGMTTKVGHDAYVNQQGFGGEVPGFNPFEHIFRDHVMSC
ncbi:hypothetical protein RIF29_34573 [Crotalaria pallida]|uniref:Secreted protein n=1 Tax=Crotalaria pallida TaxID=3830 RepID=A0AAN9HXG6_CROPI